MHGRPSPILGALCVVAVFGGACHSQKKPPKDAPARAVTKEDLTPPAPEVPVAVTLPDPSSVPPPPRAPAGTLRVHLDAEPTHLHPIADADASVRAITDGLVYQTLLDCSGGAYRPLLAESWDVSDDGMRIALRMRAGVRWHDKHAFGVLDAQATLEPLLRSSGEPSVLKAELADVASIELVTERTIRLVLKRPSDLALRALCDVPMLPAHLIEGVRPESSPIARAPIGTGPFRFVSWERGKRVRLQRAPDAWTLPGAPNVGVEEIVFDFDPDAVHALNRARRGELEVLPRVLDVHYPDQVAPATLHGGATLVRLEPPRTTFLVVNHKHEPLGDARVRRAMSMLWDRERFAHELHKDLLRPIGGPVFGAEPAPRPPAFDRKRAAAILDEAGVRDSNADGVRDRDGHPIRFTLLAPQGSRTLGVEVHAFVLEMRKTGLLVDVVNADPATFMARLRRGDFDLAPLVWEGAADETPQPLFGAGGAFNYGNVELPALEALWDAFRVAPGEAGRRPLLAQMARIITDEQPMIFLYRTDVPALVSTHVHGLAAVGDHLDLRRAWLDP
ncbi:MAG TPA: ABC transporter substrate-binding protein [Polyangia bacterium]|nr:ABC transporter substrate-binding protein [Polyangia bacterium]